MMLYMVGIGSSGTGYKKLESSSENIIGSSGSIKD